MATVEELTEQARAAQSEEELAAIEAQAEGRKGVADALEVARARLDAARASTSGNQPPAQGNASAQIAQAQAPQGRHVGGPKPASSAVRVPQGVASAESSARIPDALGNLPEQRNTALPLDRTAVVEIDGAEAAVPSDDAEVGPHGLALPQAGEVGGGNIQKVLEAPPSLETLGRPMAKEQAAMTTKVGQQIAGLIARPVTEWGVIGPGEVIRGHMLLLDLNTGEKVRAMDGHRVNAGELYVNLRNVPESLATGDTIERVLGSS